MPTAVQTTTIKLEAKTKKRLQTLGLARRRSANWLFKEAIRQCLDREERRERLNRDTVAAWEDYQRTGLHVTGEEMDEWMSAIAEGRDVPMPEPHR